MAITQQPDSLFEKLTGGPKRVVARPFGTPLILPGLVWIPVDELAAWLVFSILSARPGRAWKLRLLAGALKTGVSFGSEWGHNLAHAAAARAIGKPMDELRVYAGLPRVVFYEINNGGVTPGQHILRALAGPVFNAGLGGLFRLLGRAARPGTIAAEVVEIGVGTNTFLALAGAFLPIPGLDGGSILKWALVKSGRSAAQADFAVRRANAPLGLVLWAAGLLAWRKQRWLGLLLGALGGTALLAASGKIKE